MAITLRPPTVVNAPSQIAFVPPSISWLSGTWHVTHSTLPMWKSKKNVRITYTLLPSTSENGTAGETDRLDDLVSYQPLGSDKVKAVHGIDKASSKNSGAWNWRGKGWLTIASSHWEVLGYGNQGEEWVVTYFAKTLFTPAGIDIYARPQPKLSSEIVVQIRKALGELPDTGLQELAGSIFEIQHDDKRPA
ncbi:MAG: hypothetical protein M1835_005072 [Candelina submexicana]|nr:MAG: hypothetical protein M1835_005072 [Candelina submexicana]